MNKGKLQVVFFLATLVLLVGGSLAVFIWSPALTGYSIIDSAGEKSLLGDNPPKAVNAVGENSLNYVSDINGLGPGWVFSYMGSEDHIEYYLFEGEVSEGLFTIHAKLDDYTKIVPVRNGGTYYYDSSEVLQGPAGIQHTPTPREPVIQGNTLNLEYSENDGFDNTKSYNFTIIGKTLVIDVVSDPLRTQFPNNYGGLSLGNLEGYEIRNVEIDYMMNAPISVVLDSAGDAQFFYSLYFDITQTNGQSFREFGQVANQEGCSTLPHSNSCYIYFGYLPRKDSSEIMPLRERAYLTVSDTVDDLVLDVNNPVSPYRDSILNRTLVDWYGNDLARFFDDDAIVLQWTSPEVGEAVVNVDLIREDIRECVDPTSEGIIFSIKKNGVLLDRELVPGYDWTHHTVLLSAPIQLGDNITFETNAPKSTCEFSNLSINISLNGVKYSFPEQYSNTQGDNGWSYLELLDGEYVPLEWDPELNRWQSLDYYGYINEGGFSPRAGRFFYHDRSVLEEFNMFGIEDVMFTYYVTQNYGWDAIFSGLMPSSITRGGVLGLKSFADLAKSFDYMFSIYTISAWLSETFPETVPDYFSLYSDHRVFSNTGEPTYRGIPPSRAHAFFGLGICEGGTNFCGENIEYNGQLYTFVCPLDQSCFDPGYWSPLDIDMISKSLDGRIPFYKVDLEDAETAYDLDYIYSDVYGGGFSDGSIDRYRDDTNSKTISGVLQSSNELSVLQRELVGGPAFSEPSVNAYQPNTGGNARRIDTLMAGYADIRTLSPDKVANHTMIPHYAHMTLNELYSTYGYGLVSRTLVDANPGIVDVYTPENIDLYRSFTLGFGFGSYLWNEVNLRFGIDHYVDFIPTFVKEYYLLKTFLPLYRGVGAPEISYFDNGAFVDLSEAIRRNLDFENPKILLEYPNGFVMYINYDADGDWLVPATPYGDITLPQYGHVLFSSSGDYFGASYLEGGRRVDFVSSPDYVLRDGRGFETIFLDGVTSTNLEIEVSGDLIYCEPRFGCFRNPDFRPPSNLEVIPSAIIASSPDVRQTFKIIGDNIDKRTRLFYNGQEVSPWVHVVREGEVVVVNFGQYNSNSNPVFELRNPNGSSSFVDLIVGDSDSDSDSVPHEIDSCPNTPLSLRGNVNRRNGCPVPVLGGLTPRLTTDFFAVRNLSSIQNLLLGVVDNSSIEFLENVSVLMYDSLSEYYYPVDFSDESWITLGHNFVSLNASFNPSFDSPAIVRFFNLEGSNRLIFRDGSFCEDCSIRLYSEGILEFEVSGFSNYTSVEGFCGDSVCSFSESCNTCQPDCGSCSNSNSGSGSSGSGSSGSGHSPGLMEGIPYINLDIRGSGIFNRSQGQEIVFTYDSVNYTLEVFSVAGSEAVFSISPGSLFVSSNVDDSGYFFDISGDFIDDVYLDVLQVYGSESAIFEIGSFMPSIAHINETLTPSNPSPGSHSSVKGDKLYFWVAIGLLIAIISASLAYAFTYLTRKKKKSLHMGKDNDVFSEVSFIG